MIRIVSNVHQPGQENVTTINVMRDTSKMLIPRNVIVSKLSLLFDEINSLLSEARLFGWLMNSTPQWDSNPGPWNKALSRQKYMTVHV